MAVTKVKSAWVSGNLVFYDSASAAIMTVDGANRKFSMANASILVDPRPYAVRIGSLVAVASAGADAIDPNAMFVAPAALKLVSAWRVNISASDVTKGTATTSASYRRTNLVANVTGAGSGTTILASQNATASAASLVSRAFATTANNTVAAGAIILASHLSVGAATADGTDLAASNVFIAYELL